MKAFLCAGLACLGVLLAARAASAATITLGPGDDIQAAITAATAGDVIVLKPGVYIQSFTVDKQLTFKGSPGKSILDGAGLQSSICYVNGGVLGCVFTGLTFRFTDASSTALTGGGGNDGTQITKCSFVGNSSFAVNLSGSDISITKCTFRSSGGGATVNGGSGTVLAGNRHSACAGWCAYVSGPGTITKCTADFVSFDGAFYLAGAVTVTGVRVTRSYGGVETGSDPTGVLVSGASGDLISNDFVDIDGNDHTIDRCKATHVVGDAFRISNSDGGTITSCSATFVEDGASVFGSDGLIQGNRISHCQTAIYLGVSNSGGSALDNRASDCFESGIEVLSHTSATVRGNSFSRVSGEGDGESAAILVVNSPNSVIDANRIGDVDGGSGITILTSDTVTVSSNDISDVAFHGISLAGATTYNYSYPYGGFYTTDTVDNTVVTGNRVSGAGSPFFAGISCYITVGCTVSGNTVTESAGTGIILDLCDTTTVSGNAVTGTGKDGILVLPTFDSGNNVIDGNSVRGAGAEGIENDATGGTGTVIRNNTVTDSGLAPFANAGDVNVGLSTGNTPATDWATVPQPRQRL